ncbi:hypothetical protein OH77DRAFT_1510645 [Trametes cingulata]|nr:hypothetical protein OH77DRAFT_1510645 [Trametes cingulata]
MGSLDRAAQALRVAKLIAADIPVPGLSTALELALSIIEIAKDARDARDECALLAERAANISLGIYDQLKACPWDGESAPIATREHVSALLCTLQDIENAMRRRQKKRLLSLVWKRDDVADEVKKLTIRLEDSMQLFTVQAALDVSQGVNALTGRFARHAEDSVRLGDALLRSTRDIDAKCSSILQRVTLTETSDGTLRYFSRADFDLLSEDITERSLAPRQGARSGVSRYRATLRTEPLRDMAVVVHVYRRRDRRFSEAVDLAKRLWHPNIVSTLGYSRPSDPFHSFIVTENTHPFEEYLNTLHGAQRLRLIMKTASTDSLCMYTMYTPAHLTNLMQWKEMIVATEYLEDEGLGEILRVSAPVQYDDLYPISPKTLAVDPRGADCVKLSLNQVLTAGSEGTDGVVLPPLGGNYYAIKGDREFHAAILQFFEAVDLDAADSGEIADCWTRLLHGEFTGFSQCAVAPGIAGKFRAFWAEGYGAIPRVGQPMIHYADEERVGPHPCAVPESSGVKITFKKPDILPGPPHGSLLFILSDDGLKPAPGSGDRYSDEAFAARREYSSDDYVCDMDLTFDFDGGWMKWTRFTLKRVPLDAAQSRLLFTQSLQPYPRMPVPKAPPPQDPSISLAEPYLIRYYTETALIAADEGAQLPVPLYFFMLHHTHREQCLDENSVPWGFWSIEENPTSFPTDITFDPTLYFEGVNRYREVARSFRWTQVLGGYTFLISTRVMLDYEIFPTDEVLFLQRHYYGSVIQEEPSMHSRDLSNPGDCGSDGDEDIGDEDTVYDAQLGDSENVKEDILKPEDIYTDIAETAQFDSSDDPSL